MKSVSSFDTIDEMLDAIGCSCKIQTVDNQEHIGIVYAVDPITKTIVVKEATGSKMNIIMQHAIKSIQLSQERIKIFSQQPVLEVTDEVKERKLKLISWLQNNHIHVTEEENSLVIEKQVTIVPPYGIEQCYCDSTIVLERIQGLISKMDEAVKGIV